MNRFSYHMYEMAHAALVPARAMTDATKLALLQQLQAYAKEPIPHVDAQGAERQLERQQANPLWLVDLLTLPNTDRRALLRSWLVKAKAERELAREGLDTVRAQQDAALAAQITDLQTDLTAGL